MAELMVPKHHIRAREEALRANPAEAIKPRPEGTLPFDDDWFDAEKKRIRARCGATLGDYRLVLNSVLVAIFKRPSQINGIQLPDSFTSEDIYQGVAGLVLKLGPRCFENSDVLTWTVADKFAEDDWVTFRRGDGWRLRINGVDCYQFDTERGIKSVIKRPDMVF